MAAPIPASSSDSAIETIFAPASAPGRAGVAVLRVSGPSAWESLAALINPAPVPVPRQTGLRTLRDPVSHETIDQAMVIGFRAPHSFTGEDVVEYHIHGGASVRNALLSSLSSFPGHRMAAPGEFTRRAFENDKMDLTSAEAVADLIDADTDLQRHQALMQMGGALSRLYDGWRDRLIRALAHMEADLDFPDEDLPEGVSDKMLPILDQIIAEIAAHLDDNRRGERLRDGIQVAVVGAPNAGKSSLVNALAGRDVAIVSDMPGTTRDIIEVHLDIGGYPVIIADTAGLRPDRLSDQAQDVIEGEGIRRALDRARNADIRLILFDAETLSAPDLHSLALLDSGSLPVINKCELLDESGPDSLPASLLEYDPVFISVRTDRGLDALTTALATRIERLVGRADRPSLTRQRHRTALEQCLAALRGAKEAPMPELMAEDVRIAMRALGHITGRVDVEDVLDVVFRDFCIGK